MFCHRSQEMTAFEGSRSLMHQQTHQWEHYHSRFIGKHQQWLTDMTESDNSNRGGSNSRSNSIASKSWWHPVFMVTARGAQWEVWCLAESQWYPAVLEEQAWQSGGCLYLLMNVLICTPWVALNWENILHLSFLFFFKVSCPVEISLLVYTHDIFYNHYSLPLHSKEIFSIIKHVKSLYAQNILLIHVAFYTSYLILPVSQEYRNTPQINA